MSEIFSVSADRAKIDTKLVVDFVLRSYWGKGRKQADILTSLENSLCFSAFKGHQQIGFARVVTDQVYFAYLADVFILERERGHGYGQQLMKYILADERLKNISRFMLASQDAQKFYQSLGFECLNEADKNNLMRFSII